MSESFENVNDCEDEYIDLGEDDLKMGLVFKTEEVAMKSIQLWSEKTFCPLSKVSLKLEFYSWGNNCLRTKIIAISGTLSETQS